MNKLVTTSKHRWAEYRVYCKKTGSEWEAFFQCIGWILLLLILSPVLIPCAIGVFLMQAMTFLGYLALDYFFKVNKWKHLLHKDHHG